MTNPPEKPPLDIFLGALNVVALPLVSGDDSEEMRETAQFYGYEDWPEGFKNVWPRITELIVYTPSPEQPGVVIELTTPRFLLPGAFHRAAARWAKATRLAPAGANTWRGNGLVLTLETSRGGGKFRARAVLSPSDN